MNEAETRAEHIDPALKAAGWGVVEGSKILREYPITPGRIEGHGKRGKALTADYVLVYRNRTQGPMRCCDTHCFAFRNTQRGNHVPNRRLTDNSSGASIAHELRQYENGNPLTSFDTCGKSRAGGRLARLDDGLRAERGGDLQGLNGPVDSNRVDSV